LKFSCEPPKPTRWLKVPNEPVLWSLSACAHEWQSAEKLTRLEADDAFRLLERLNQTVQQDADRSNGTAIECCPCGVRKRSS
jgi:hypothetical protein